MMDYPTPCTIGVGSNTADREERVNRAIEHVTHLLSKSSVSSVYESDAIETEKTPPYLNAVIHGLSPVNSTALVKFSRSGKSRRAVSRMMWPTDRFRLILTW